MHSSSKKFLVKQYHVVLICLFLFLSPPAIAQLHITFFNAWALMDTTITRITIKDTKELLEKACKCTVDFDNPQATIQIYLPEIHPDSSLVPTRFEKAASFPYKHYPIHDYQWIQQKPNDSTYILHLIASTHQAVSFGLYGLLQEKLGFQFYHPRNTVIPNLKTWPLSNEFEFTARPLFDKKGFHLHTQHPIELTEYLLNPTIPEGLDVVKEYIDWLVRNGQNYFEFCLLNSIDKKQWIEHAKKITDYCHQRGIFVSVDVSLHMIQQKNFQLYTSSIGKKKQIRKNLAWLNQANWDFMHMEFTTAEFFGGNRKKREKLRFYILDWLDKHSSTKLMGRQHIVKPEREYKRKKHYAYDSLEIELDKKRGVMAHTVMFYDMTEPHAPVYENENQRHMFEFMLKQHKQRETWYYPESAYWVTFDNSIPMTLLPYLTARLADIDTCVAYQIPGHITFSSGWEWGYWLFDWSIARWSWQYTYNQKKEIRTADMFVKPMLNDSMLIFFQQAIQTQQEFLKNQNLIQWLTAMTVIDEIPFKKFSLQFQPRPHLSYKYIRRRATLKEINLIESTDLPRLKSFADTTYHLITKFANQINDKNQHHEIVHELFDGIYITGLRALHRYYILKYLIEIRKNKLLNKNVKLPNTFLEQAKLVRLQALQLVKKREAGYRYPYNLIATRFKDHTAYRFGYLYTVSNLHFWNREEQQAKKNRYGPFFMNIFNIARIMGFIK
ncbi:MAG: hypothetical protein N2167_01185 [Flavobacteriales bacterium]|nr:hypothetical protein [Flavobacteriales bacterium]